MGYNLLILIILYVDKNSVRYFLTGLIAMSSPSTRKRILDPLKVILFFPHSLLIMLCAVSTDGIRMKAWEKNHKQKCIPCFKSSMWLKAVSYRQQ